MPSTPPRPAALVRRATVQVLNDTQANARRFAEADRDGNQQLDFDEFLAMQPAGVRKRFGSEQIRAWFDAAECGARSRA